MKRNAGLLCLPEEWTERFLAKVETWEAEGAAGKQAQIDRLKAELAAVKVKIERINMGFTDGSLDIAEFRELKNPLVPRKVELEAQIIALERTKTNRLEPLRNWISEAHGLEKSVSEGNWSEMTSFLKKAGSNRLLRAQSLTVSFVKPWQALAETNLAVRDTNDLPAQCANWWTLLGSNQ